MENESEQKFDYGSAIVELREARGTSREALASAAGISPSYLYEVERGLKRPSTDVLAKLAAALGMLPSQLLEYVELEAPHSDRSAVSPKHAIADPASRRRWAHRSGPLGASAAMMTHSHSGSPTLRALLSVAQELDHDDLRVLLELARHLLAKRK
jgi:transcriptional regulator with XRE-family HTH domain